MRKSGDLVRLDPTPDVRANLRLVELGMVVEFIPKEWLNPESQWFVPPSERYWSHQVSCPAIERTLSASDAAFIAECERRLAARPDRFTLPAA